MSKGSIPFAIAFGVSLLAQHRINGLAQRPWFRWDVTSRRPRLGVHHLHSTTVSSNLQEAEAKEGIPPRQDRVRPGQVAPLVVPLALQGTLGGGGEAGPRHFGLHLRYRNSQPKPQLGSPWRRPWK